MPKHRRHRPKQTYMPVPADPIPGYSPWLHDPELSCPEQALAAAVMRVALEDAGMTSTVGYPIAPHTRQEARTWLLSPQVQFWADAADMTSEDLRKIAELLGSVDVPSGG